MFIDRYTLYYQATMYAVKDDLPRLEERCALAKHVAAEGGCICNDNNGGGGVN